MNSSFKKVTVIEQKKNLGPVSNSLWLKDYLINNNYDRWISTEDDNVFSRNFLMYIDKGLELFENDNSVQAICGCHDLGKIEDEGNVIKQMWYHPHGNATWKNKYMEMKSNILNNLMDANNYSFKSMFRLFFHSKFLFQYYVCNILCDRTGWIWTDGDKIKLFDVTQTLYNYFTNKCCVVPQKYKSHSCGFDGSGVGEFVRRVDPDKEWPLDNDKTFEYRIPKNFVINKSSYKTLNKSFSVGYAYLMYVWFQYVVFRLSGDNWKVVHRMVLGIRKIMRKEKNTLSNYS